MILGCDFFVAANRIGFVAAANHLTSVSQRR